MVDSGEVVEEGTVLLLAEQAGADRGPQVPQLQAVVHVEVVQGQPRGWDAGGRGSLGGKKLISEMLNHKIPRHPSVPSPASTFFQEKSSAAFCAAKLPGAFLQPQKATVPPTPKGLVVPGGGGGGGGSGPGMAEWNRGHGAGTQFGERLGPEWCNGGVMGCRDRLRLTLTHFSL